MEKLELEIKAPCTISEKLTELGFGYNEINALLRKRDIRVNNVKTSENVTLQVGDNLTIFYLQKKSEKQFEYIFEDDNIIVVNKPYGIEIEGQNGLASKTKTLPVHRLDRNTTGLVLLAKNADAQQILFEAIKNHKIEKRYYAEVVGKTDFKNFTFNAFLVKDNQESKVKIYEKKVKNSVAISTTFNTIKSSSTTSLIECILHTGKTHQIRASLAYLKHPIIGDGKYGRNEINKSFKENKQRLHSYYIKLNGITGKLAYLNNKRFTAKPKWLDY